MIELFFQEEDPLWIVTVLRVAMAFAVTVGVVWLAGFVAHELKGWFGK